MPWVFLYVPLWRWFPTNVSSDDGKHVVFWFFLCGKKFPRSFSSFVGGPASDRSETVASLISSQRIIPLAKTSGDDLRLGWIGAYKESNLLFRHHRPSRCKKNGTSFDVDMKITLLQMKISGSTEFIFFLVLLLPVAARSCAGCSQGWNYFVFCSGLMQLGSKSWVPGGFKYFIFSPNRKGKWSNYIQLDSYFSDELTKTTNGWCLIHFEKPAAFDTLHKKQVKMIPPNWKKKIMFNSTLKKGIC